MNNELGKYILIIPMLSLITACAPFGQHETKNVDCRTIMHNARSYKDHGKLTHYYEDQAKEIKLRAEEKKRELANYGGHSYVYGRQGQDFASHTLANIHYYIMKIESKKQEKHSQRAKTQLSSDSSNKL